MHYLPLFRYGEDYRSKTPDASLRVETCLQLETDHYRNYRRMPTLTHSIHVYERDYLPSEDTPNQFDCSKMSFDKVCMSLRQGLAEDFCACFVGRCHKNLDRLMRRYELMEPHEKPGCAP